MSTKNVENLTSRSTLQGSGQVATSGKITQGFGDQTGIHPVPGSEGEPTTNKGGKLLNTFGAPIPDDTIQGNEAEYGQVYEYATPQGHVIEYNDTSSSERIMLRHKSGTGINIGPDGSIIISSKRRVDVVNEDYILSVTGDGKLSFQGNLSLSVTGDFNVDVGGEFKVTSQKKTERVNGPSTTTIYGDEQNIVTGNQSNIVTGGGFVQYLEGLNTIVKGETRYAVEGDFTIANSGVLTMTAQQEIVLTSPEANIAANNLSVFGSTGTIGGDNIIAYVKNIYGTSSTFTAGVTAPTFHGDLDGTAALAVTSDNTNHQNYDDPPGAHGGGGGVGAPVGYSVTDTATDITATAQPTAAIMTDYQTKGSKGVRKVVIDPDNIIKNNINLTTKTGGVTNKELDGAQIRAKLRDPAHRNNSEFITYALSQGLLSPDYAKTSPPNISSIEDTSNIVIQGQTTMGSPSLALTSKRIRAV